jgi:hypothetical protein
MKTIKNACASAQPEAHEKVQEQGHHYLRHHRIGPYAVDVAPSARHAR